MHTTTIIQAEPPMQALATTPACISFLLLPDFSMIAFVSAVEPLRVANRMAGRQLFSWQVLSLDGAPVTASNGMAVVADSSYADAGQLAMVFVCASFAPERCADQHLHNWLRRMAAYGTVIGAIDTGSYLLARARLLNGYRATLHWEGVAAFSEAFPAVQVTQELFEIDRNRLTCAGGTAAMDMMLHLVAQRHGQALAVAISEQFIQNRIRPHSDHQRTDLSTRIDTYNPHVLRVVARMEANIETPLSAAALARATGISLRQLERLFAAELGATPQQYYLRIRLAHARQLLQQTDMQVIAVALACGFGSAAPFSRAYKAHFGRTPRQDRQTGFA